MFVYNAVLDHLRLGLFCYVFVRNMQLLVGCIGCILMMSLLLNIYLLKYPDIGYQIWQLPFRNKKVNLSEILVFIMRIKAIFILEIKEKILKFKEDFEILFWIFISHFY